MNAHTATYFTPQAEEEDVDMTVFDEPMTDARVSAWAALATVVIVTLLAVAVG
jgi:hypothetical protein